MTSIGINIPSLVAGAAEQILEANPENYRSTVPGPQGLQGIAGRNIHHIIHDRSILPDSTVVAGIGRGSEFDDEIGPGVAGNKDVYEAYADEEELANVGEITVKNGNGAYMYAVTGGFIGTEEDFTSALSNILSIINTAEAARDKAKLWAEESEDVEVETGEYSSLHWAAKAKTDTLNALAIADLKVNVADIIDNVTSLDTNKPLSANQGKLLNDNVTAINLLLASDDTTLDELQEVVNFIKANRDDLDTLTLDNIAETASNKWFTLAYRDKLDGIETGATSDQTGGEIKAAYEAEADTNAYTDSEKTLVDVDTVLTTTATTLTTGVNELNSKVNTVTGTTEW